MHRYDFAFLLFFHAFFACKLVSEDAQLPTANLVLNAIAEGQQLQGKAPSGAANIVFKSTDDGKTWQDISAGLPENLQSESAFAGDAELYLHTQHGIYRSGNTPTAPAWEKEISFDDLSTTFLPSRTRLISFDSKSYFFQNLNGTGVWLPTNAQDKSLPTILETPDGTVLFGTSNGLFQSADHGKTWKHVVKDGWVMKIVASEGVLLCTNQHGILRSTDGGEHWDSVLSEGGVGIAVEVIKGGFAAITYNTKSKTRRVRTSTDGGQTWQPIDADLPPTESIASIKQVGEYFFCGHPDGIFRSSDGGKTWELLLPSIEKKVFNLSVSGKVIYAVPRDGGC